MVDFGRLWNLHWQVEWAPAVDDVSQNIKHLSCTSCLKSASICFLLRFLFWPQKCPVWPHGKMHAIRHNDSSKLVVLLQALIISVKWLAFVQKRRLLLRFWVATLTSEYLPLKKQFCITLKDFCYQNTEHLHLGVLNFIIDIKTWKIFSIFSWKEHCIWVTWCSGCLSSYVA